ncbi:MCE family protein [Mycolicibacillus parakoreensis]|uniref:MCE family protein n=1 Tax=Mycolicibacillus parakoreensis TaxID=1069221 RepID=A0ABY3TUN9_9MYCO|nr:MCE family protein [Mycolicibacillus parakoreensis]MCV7317095.1 MCE family protein [Mycolicibacillus parakoreensis]ULN51419.1 MCE family protein [Mycolicibacillus parakoreensis]
MAGRLAAYRRPLIGLATLAVIAVLIVVPVGLFRGSFTTTVPVTVLSERAGLVMQPDAKVKMRGVQVGKVGDIEPRPDGTAVLHLRLDPGQLRLIPANVSARIASTTVFGAKSVELVAPAAPVSARLRAGQVLSGEHVTVEINTVFQQLVRLLDKIDPMKLNETLGAVSTAFNGRGHKIGQALTDFDHLLAELEPSLDILEHEAATMPSVARSYADAAPDLTDILANTSVISDSIVEERDNLNTFLLSAIGLADTGNEVVGENRAVLTDLTRALEPTAALLDKYHEHLGCAIGGLVPFAKSPPFQVPGIIISASFTLGRERYRYPDHLPKVSATAERSYCSDLGLPDVPPEFRVPSLIADVGADPYEYGNQGILINSDGLKEALFGPIGGPPRNSAQVGMPG